MYLRSHSIGGEQVHLLVEPHNNISCVLFLLQKHEWHCGGGQRPINISCGRCIVFRKRRLHCDFLGLAGKTNTVCGKRLPVLLLTRYGAAPSQGISCWHQGQAFPALVLVGLIVFVAVSEALVNALREDSTVPWRSRVDLQAFLYVVCGVLVVWLAATARMSGARAKCVGEAPRADH